YPFKQPERVFYNPYNPTQLWVTGFGGGMFMGTTAVPVTPPTASVTGPATGTSGQALTFTVGASTPASTGTAAASSSTSQYTYQIDWDGNGSVDQTVTGGSSVPVAHSFGSAGSYTVKVTVAE